MSLSIFGTSIAETNWTQLNSAVEKCQDTGASSVPQNARRLIERWRSDTAVEDSLKNLDTQMESFAQSPVVLFQYGDNDAVYHASILITDKSVIFSKYSYPNPKNTDDIREHITKVVKLNKHQIRASKNYAAAESLKEDALKYYNDDGDFHSFAGTTSQPFLFVTIWKDGNPETIAFHGIPLYPTQKFADSNELFFEKYFSLFRLLNFSAYLMKFTIWEQPYLEETSHTSPLKFLSSDSIQCNN